MMSEKENTPSELEFLLQAGRDGQVTLSTVFQVLLRSEVWVLLNREPKPDLAAEEVKPLMTKTEDNKPSMVLFSNEETAVAAVGKYPDFQHPQKVPGAGLIDSLSSQVALLINPGLSYGLSITSEGVVELRNRLGPGFLKNIPVK
jgi:hypothetical protein